MCKWTGNRNPAAKMDWWSLAIELLLNFTFQASTRNWIYVELLHLGGKKVVVTNVVSEWSILSKGEVKIEHQSEMQISVASAIMWMLLQTVMVKSELSLPVNMYSNPHLRSWALGNVPKWLRSPTEAVSSSDIWHKLIVEPLLLCIELAWFEHLIRMLPGSFLVEVFQAEDMIQTQNTLEKFPIWPGKLVWKPPGKAGGSGWEGHMSHLACCHCNPDPEALAGGWMDFEKLFEVDLIPQNNPNTFLISLQC